MSAEAEIKVVVDTEEADRKLKVFQGGIDVLGGSLEATVGSLALFGVENEWISNLEQGAVGAIAVADGIKRFGDGVVSLAENLDLASIAQKAYNGVQAVFNAIMSANPVAIVLLSITALVGAVVALKDRFEAVNKVFTFFADLARKTGEFLGLTETEEEKNARLSRERSEQRILDIENEIKVRKSAGEDTIELEREKLQTILELTEEGSQEQKDALADLQAFEAEQIKKAQDEADKAEEEAKKKREEAKKQREKEKEEKRKQDEKDAEEAKKLKEKEEADALKAKEKADAEAEKQREKELADAKKQAEELVRIEEERAQAIIEAEQDLAEAKAEAVFGGLNALKTLAGENEKLQNALFAVEQGAAIADILVRLQAEKAANAAYAATLGPAGPAYLIPKNQSANIRAGIAVANVVATSISKFKGGRGGGDLGGSDGGATTFTPQAGAQFNFVEQGFDNQTPNTTSQPPIQAYVLANDVSNGLEAQQLLNNRRIL